MPLLAVMLPIVSFATLPALPALAPSLRSPSSADTGDLGVDTTRRRIAIPRLEAHVVELWQLPQ